MRVIFCDNVLDNHIIDADYSEEMNSVISNELTYSLISYEELIEGNIFKALRFVKQEENIELGIYRGWMLTDIQYKNLYDGLIKKNIQLINSHSEYSYCHYLPNSYDKIQHLTPKSVWTLEQDCDVIFELVKIFEQDPIIIKDFVKSEKHNWDDACFIHNASDKDKLKSTVTKFIELRGQALNKGLVFRKFEELEFLTKHSKSGMPLTKEFRLFFFNKELVVISNYWDEGDYKESMPNLDSFIEISKTIQSNFFTMDIAKKKNGEWIIMELGDGQVSGLPESIDKNNFYKKLKENLK